MDTSEPFASLISRPGVMWSGEDIPVRQESVRAALQAAVDGVYTVISHSSATFVLNHLDTVDARLIRAGIHLMHSSADSELLAVRDGETARQSITAMQLPAQLGSLPPGPVRDLVAGPAWIRAVVSYGRTRSRVWTYAVLNGDEKTVARVTWLTSDQTSESGAPGARVRVVALRGYDKAAAAVGRALVALPAVKAADQSWLEDLPASTAPRVTQRRPPTVDPDDPADVTVARALSGYLDDIEANVRGVIDDIDTEFLHELRVAVRRTRSILKSVGDVLPDGVADRVSGELRWLGQVTAPTRDLDVYLLGLDAMAAEIAHPGDLAPFGMHVRRNRVNAHRALARALRSKRFTAFVTDWREQLNTVLETPANPAAERMTAATLADRRIRQTFTKVAKRAAAINADSPSESVHALRKQCKTLRYLMELFEPICDRRRYKQVLNDFKALQSVLGEFQDGEVQAAALRRAAQEMVESGDVPSSALLAMGDLSGRFATRQRQARVELDRHHNQYLGKQAARHIDGLVSR